MKLHIDYGDEEDFSSIDSTLTDYLYVKPSKEHIPAYLYAKKLLESQIDGLPIMDALSDYEFYEQGLVGVPVCSNDHIRPFLENHVPGLCQSV